MVFFANSGVVWPTLEDKSRLAGERALKAGGKLFQLLAVVEGNNSSGEPKNAADFKRECVSELGESANLYRQMLSGVSEKYVAILLSDIELAAIDSPFPSIDFLSWTRRYLSGDSVDIRSLYVDLIQRIEILAVEVDTFDPGRKKIQLAPSAFRLMRQWENLATLGRLIAALNRRQQ